MQRPGRRDCSVSASPCTAWLDSSCAVSLLSYIPCARSAVCLAVPDHSMRPYTIPELPNPLNNTSVCDRQLGANNLLGGLPSSMLNLSAVLHM